MKMMAIWFLVLSAFVVASPTPAQAYDPGDTIDVVLWGFGDTERILGAMETYDGPILIENTGHWMASLYWMEDPPWTERETVTGGHSIIIRGPVTGLYVSSPHLPTHLRITFL